DRGASGLPRDGDRRTTPPAAQAAEPSPEPAARAAAMIMSSPRYRMGARRARWLATGFLASCLAFAQAPADPAAAQAPQADAKDAGKSSAAPGAAGPADAEKGAVPGAAKGAPPPRKSAPPAVPETPPAGPLGPLAWLSGCWWGEVNRHEFREYW